MPRTVLQLRMETLTHHLEEAKDPDSWIGLLRLENKPDKNLWLVAVDRIQREADDQLAALRVALDGLKDGTCPVDRAWSVYSNVQRSSEDIFRECLELIGGLALRDRISEEYVCRFADELIKECATVVGKLSSFAIPAFEDTVSSTFRRVARVRFPDWHLWTLPIVAYEYGHVIVRETHLSRLAKELADEWSEQTLGDLIKTLQDHLPTIDSVPVRQMAEGYLANMHQSPRQASDEFGKLVRILEPVGETTGKNLAQAAAGSIAECWALAERRAQVLLADAFATFTAGPAYACAALILRLNPEQPSVPGRPTDLERGAMILAMLTAMSEAAPQPPPFQEIINTLTAEWQSVLTGSTIAQPSASPSLGAPIDAKRVLDRFRIVLVKPDQAAYTKEDWLLAENWSHSWSQALKNGMSVDIPSDDLKSRRLRDVLNTAWLCRQQMLQNTQNQEIERTVESIADAARMLCDRIIAERTAENVPADFGGPAPRPLPASV